MVSPLVHFRKVLDNKELRDLSSNHPLTASALNDLRELPANVTCLLQQCEAVCLIGVWLVSENSKQFQVFSPCQTFG